MCTYNLHHLITRHIVLRNGDAFRHGGLSPSGSAGPRGATPIRLSAVVDTAVVLFRETVIP